MSASTVVSLPIAAFSVVDGPAAAPALLVCDHASALVPPELGDLGLAPAALGAHIAWDIGAARVTRLLAARLNCPAVLAGVSRLVVDCNRRSDDPSWMPAITCGVAVPGNAGLDDAARMRRADAWYHPYHHEIGRRLDLARAAGAMPALISLHSFTPCLGAAPRPWHVGVLWNQDGRLAQPLMAALAQLPGVCVGDNQPYSGREINHTQDFHAGRSGLPHVSLEIRQDLLADETGCRRWADVLADHLAPLLPAAYALAAD